jgi:hypothetical protein
VPKYAHSRVVLVSRDDKNCLLAWRIVIGDHYTIAYLNDGFHQF